VLHDVVTIERIMAKGRDNPDALWLSPRQAADLLGVSVEQVRRLAREGRLPSVKVGRAVRFKRSVIENLDELPPDA